LRSWRNQIQSGSTSLAAFATEQALRLACEELVYFSHWITPAIYARRFDTRFFLAVHPPEQEALHCQVETVEGYWIAPDEALRRHREGEFPLMFPTERHLDRMAAHPRLEDLLRFARTKTISTVLTRDEGPNGEPRIPREIESCW
jgi:hypothetical protein